jgi:hypothetical protein
MLWRMRPLSLFLHLMSVVIAARTCSLAQDIPANNARTGFVTTAPQDPLPVFDTDGVSTANSENETVVYPPPGSPSYGNSELTGGLRYYDVATTNRPSIGATGAFTQDAPYVAPGDFHSLAELAVGDRDSLGQIRNLIEVGWTVEPGIFGDLNPHLFVFYWVNGCPGGYDRNFTPVNGARFHPGMIVHVTDTPVAHGIRYDQQQDRWWVFYDNQWIGYFRGDLWNGLFRSSEFAEWFGEVSPVNVITPANILEATQMGNGAVGTYPKSASIQNMGTYAESGEIVPANPKYTQNYCVNSVGCKGQNIYVIGNKSATGFNYGGPNLSASFGPASVPGTSVVFDPDNVLSAEELSALSANLSGGDLSATPAVKAIQFHSAPGQRITISASGDIDCCDGTPNTGPDGYLPDVGITSLGSISGYGGPGFALLAVFTDGNPTGAAPPSYDYSGGTAQSAFAPLLNQAFFIGDGLTGADSGNIQSFFVPEGATELWLGIADTYVNGSGPPGGYGDNTGSFVVSGRLFSSGKNQ